MLERTGNLQNLLNRAHLQWKMIIVVLISTYATLWLFIEPLNLFNVGNQIVTRLGLYGYLALFALALFISVSAEFVRLFYIYYHISKEARESLARVQDLYIIQNFEEIIRENLSIVNDAEKVLITTGSRSRDVLYLQAIEHRLSSCSNLLYYRILFGPPHFNLFKQHLLRLLKIRDSYDRRLGYQTFFIGLFDNFTFQSEVHICGNEKRALIVLPSFTSIGNYDTALLIRNTHFVDQLIRFVQELYAASAPVETRDQIKKLKILRRPDIPARGA